MIAKKPQKTHYFQPKILPIPMDRKPGRILYDTPHFRYDHEKSAVAILARFGKQITFLKPSTIPGASTPDFLWRGKQWELKSLFKSSNDRVQEDLGEAIEQSSCVALDVSHCRRGVKQTAKDAFNFLKGRGHDWNNKVILIFDRENYCIIDKTVLK